jgi:hypothetical protein
MQLLTAKLLLALAGTVILGSKSCRTDDHILLSDGYGSLQSLSVPQSSLYSLGALHREIASMVPLLLRFYSLLQKLVTMAASFFYSTIWLSAVMSQCLTVLICVEKQLWV